MFYCCFFLIFNLSLRDFEAPFADRRKNFAAKHEYDRKKERETDHAIDKCIPICGIACAAKASSFTKRQLCIVSYVCNYVQISMSVRPTTEDVMPHALTSRVVLRVAVQPAM